MENLHVMKGTLRNVQETPQISAFNEKCRIFNGLCIATHKTVYSNDEKRRNVSLSILKKKKLTSLQHSNMASVYKILPDWVQLI